MNNKIILVPLLIILTSLYLFPFFCTYLPSVNTKMFMAACSLVLLLLSMAKGNNASVDNSLFKASLYAAVVSLVGFFSVVYNGATDYTYASYIMSMWVWLGGAYVVIMGIRKVHGICSILHLCNYIIAVCVAQCTIALMVDTIPAVKNWVDGFVIGEGFMGTNKDRMYGIGASLDVAGMKFAAVLIIIAVILKKIQNTALQKYQTYYIIAYLYLFVIGSMIGRTTGIGVLLSLAYWAGTNITKFNFRSSAFKIGITIFAFSVCLSIYLYNNSPAFYTNVRFGFEGFFSLIEKGYWETNSNNHLANMIKWPDNMKTWIIGDGYFNNPLSSNPYYTGKGIGNFYMLTDIGYCRLIFYFGIVGLSAFMLYFIKIRNLCTKRFQSFGAMFTLILILNWVVWFKVSSDLFVIFAPFLLISQEENNLYMKNVGMIEDTKEI